jgi:arylsulfatase A-like enzyme
VAVAVAAGLGVAPARSGRPDTLTEAVASRPNIVFIMVDDMRDDDLRFMPSTRRLIGDRGVRFVNSFSPYPLCCPARASVLTGLYTHNHGVYTVYADYGFHAFDDRQTLATMLQRAGYVTVYLGKYLNRYGEDPPHGSRTGNSLRYVPPGWTMWRASLDGGFAPGSRWDGGTYRYFDTTLSFNGEGFESLQGRYQTSAYGDIARSIIRRRAADAQPFLLYLSFTAPHTGGPHEADDPAPTRLLDGTLYDWKTPARPTSVWGYWNGSLRAAPGASWQDPDFTDKPPYLRELAPLTALDRRRLVQVTRQRAESLTVVDRQVGAVMSALDATGEMGRTLVIFTSDNGYFLGEQRMRLGKVFPHEPSLRVPLLMRGPGIPAGAVRRDPFSSVDYLPTLADVAGTAPEHAPDGVSMWDVARHGDSGWRRAVLTETGALKHPPRTTNLAGLPLGPGETPDLRFLIGVRTERYLFVDVAGQRDELYDLRADPKEYRNLAGDPAHARVEALLRQALQQVRACRGAGCAVPLPEELRAGP